MLYQRLFGLTSVTSVGNIYGQDPARRVLHLIRQLCEEGLL